MHGTIFYYTNNLIAPELLENTLSSAISHAGNNDCEIIITSHFPLTDKYETEYLTKEEANYKTLYNPETKQKEIHPIYKHLVKNIRISVDPSYCKSYVVGKLEYSCASIVRQILFSIERCNTDYIILMEHDCLYPQQYVSCVLDALKQFQMTFVHHCVTFLNPNGYFTIKPTFNLSTCAFKKDIAKKIFERKLELLLKNVQPLKLEPSLKCIPKDIVTYPQDYFVERALNIDHFLKKNSVLDIKHYLNQSGFISSIERVANSEESVLINGKSIDEVSSGYFQEHQYWGKAAKYINMFKDYVVEKEKSRYAYGIEPF